MQQLRLQHMRSRYHDCISGPVLLAAFPDQPVHCASGGGAGQSDKHVRAALVCAYDSEQCASHTGGSGWWGQSHDCGAGRSGLWWGWVYDTDAGECGGAGQDGGVLCYL